MYSPLPTQSASVNDLLLSMGERKKEETSIHEAMKSIHSQHNHNSTENILDQQQQPPPPMQQQQQQRQAGTHQQQQQQLQQQPTSTESVLQSTPDKVAKMTSLGNVLTPEQTAQIQALLPLIIQTQKLTRHSIVGRGRSKTSKKNKKNKSKSKKQPSKRKSTKGHSKTGKKKGGKSKQSGKSSKTKKSKSSKGKR